MAEPITAAALRCQDGMVCMMKRLSTFALVLLLAVPAYAGDEPYSNMTAAAFTDGPLTPAMSLRVRSDENGYLIGTVAAYGGTDGPLTAFGNIRLRTDSNGYLLVALPGVSGFTNAFTSLPVAGQTTITSSGATALTMAAGSNVTLTTNNTTKTVMIAASGGAPGGSGSELQYRAGASTFGGVSGSSVSASLLAIPSANGVDGDVDNPATGGAAFTLTAGHGGAGNDTATGVGGGLTLTSGAGGAGLGNGVDGSTGGLLSILGGVGGAGAVADPSIGGVGGAILIQAGASGVGNNESSASGGDITIMTGDSTDADGEAVGTRSGNLLLKTGAASGGSGGGTSGTIYLETGLGGQSASSASGDSGEIRLRSGAGASGPDGGGSGQVTLRTGNAGAAASDGFGGTAGSVTLIAGNGGVGRGAEHFSGSGGDVTLTGGEPGTVTGGAILGDPGNVRLVPGTGGSVSAFLSAGGAVNISGGVLTSDSTATFTAYITTGTSPAVANIGANSCGTTAATIAGTDNAPVISTGAVAWTACRITFDTTAPNAWNCVFTNGSTHTLAATPYQSGSSTTTADIVASTLGVAADVLTGICFAR